MPQQKHLYFASPQISNPSSFPTSSASSSLSPQLQRHRQQLRRSSLPPWRSEAPKSLSGTCTQINIKVLWQTSQALTMKTPHRLCYLHTPPDMRRFMRQSPQVSVQSFAQHKNVQSSALLPELFINTIKRPPNVCQYDALIMTTKENV